MNIHFEKGLQIENAQLICQWSNALGESFQNQWMGPKISYPLIVWLIFHLILMACCNWNLAMAFFLILGIIAHFIDIRIGAGDFLFLASCALVFTLTEILILIQFASTTGILAFLLLKQKERLPFVPFLLLAACVIIFGKLLLLG